MKMLKTLFMKSIKLSILIPSTFDRLEMTQELVDFLEKQKVPGVDITVKFDNKEISIGAKRQQMIEEAKGEYIVFIDSDDMVTEDYTSTLMGAIIGKPDCIGFDVECSGTKGKTASVSNKWHSWGDLKGGYDYVRTPYHLTPIKREIALKIGYKDLRFAEDNDYSKRLKNSGLIKYEIYIGKVMYYYQYVHQDSNIKYGIT